MTCPHNWIKVLQSTTREGPYWYCSKCSAEKEVEVVVESSTKPLRFITDRSAVRLDDQCGMKYYLNRKEAGIGIVPKKEALALAIGRETHVDLSAIAEMEDISEEAIEAAVGDILSPITEEDKHEQQKMEMLYRRLGWLAAYALYMEPDIRATYDTVNVEDETILDRDPLWVAVTPDRVLRHKVSKHLEYREYKTTITASKKWMESWPYAIQLHLGLAAVQEELHEDIKFAQIMGLLKGNESAMDHRLLHPYVWAWYNTRHATWTHEYEKARGAEWVPMPVWEYPGGIVQWVKRLGPEIAKAQFPFSPPVFLNRRMLDEWVSRRLRRERIIRNTENACRTDFGLRSNIFERRTDICRPPFGDACPYLLVCWNAEAQRAPLATGEYEVRIPHHNVEVVGRKEGMIP